MKIYTTASGSSITEMRGMMEPYGHTITENVAEADVIFGWSVTVMDQTFKAFAANPKALRVVYNWDVYEWVWTNPRPQEYDYKKYGELLKMADEIWVPSECTGKRTTQWYGLENWKTVLCNIPYFDMPAFDGKYVLCTMREYPEANLYWFEKACQELNIPYMWTKHELDYHKYQKAIAGCRFIVTSYYEASTGGLSLMEAYYLGKPVLISDSPWMGGKDYLGDRAHYFDHKSFEDLKAKIKDMWENPPVIAEDHKEFIANNYSRDAFAKRMSDRLAVLAKKRKIKGDKKGAEND